MIPRLAMKIRAAGFDVVGDEVNFAVELGSDQKHDRVEIEEEQEDDHAAHGAVGAFISSLADRVDVQAKNSAQQQPDDNAEDRAGREHAKALANAWAEKVDHG